ncbi:MAG: hypothetical protein IJ055_05820 [Oscillospiraceae bacterium]|nr:hypothetical protein [Oscillospiraceae bacterium]
MKQFYEETKRGKFDHLRSAVPYGEPAEYASVHFLHFADEQEILSCVPYAFALRLRDALPGLIEQAKAFAKENGLICCYLSTTGAVFDFSDIHIDKERPDRFYLGFDAGDAPDSDPENFEYLELYRYIGFDEDLHPTGDWYDETIWR